MMIFPNSLIGNVNDLSLIPGFTNMGLQSAVCMQGVQRPVAQSAQARCQRRAVLLAVPLLPIISPICQRAEAAPAAQTSDADNPLIQELLRKTAEKKEERTKQRLQDYYKRNYEDYFNFEVGSTRSGTSQETLQQIKEYLESLKQ